MGQFSELHESRFFEQTQGPDVAVFYLCDESSFVVKMETELDHQHYAFKSETFISTAFIRYHNIDLGFVWFDIFVEEQIYVSAGLSILFVYYYKCQFQRIQEPSRLVFEFFLQS